MKTWTVLLSVLLLLLALEAESNPKGGRGGGGRSRGGSGGWWRGGSRRRGGWGGWGDSTWHSPPRTPITTGNDYNINQWSSSVSSEDTSIDWDFLNKQIDDYFRRLREINSRIKFETDPNTNTSRIANLHEYLRNMTELSDSIDFKKPRPSGTTHRPDSGTIQNSNIGSSTDLDMLPSQNSNSGSSKNVDAAPVASVDELYRVPHEKSKGDRDWLTATAPSPAMSVTRPRVQALSVPEFHSYRRRPGWRGAVGDFFETSSEEDGRRVVVMGHRIDEHKTTCVDPSCSSKVTCQVLCTPVACRRTDELPCNFTCVATTCTKTAVMLNSAETARICDGGFTTYGSCNPRQRIVDCKGFGESCNFTCSAVPCSTTGGFCNFTCPSVPCNTGESSSCKLLQLNVTKVSENHSSSNFTCKVDSCDNTERSCNHSCTSISNNSTVTGQPTEAPAKATEDFVLTTIAESSSDVKSLSQDLTNNSPTPRSTELNIAELLRKLSQDSNI